MPDAIIEGGSLMAAGGVGVFTLALIRFSYGTVKDRIDELSAERDYWRDRYQGETE